MNRQVRKYIPDLLRPPKLVWSCRLAHTTSTAIYESMAIVLVHRKGYMYRYNIHIYIYIYVYIYIYI